jgi:putative nucleotidyltransferase with HDIG domain
MNPAAQDPGACAPVTGAAEARRPEWLAHEELEIPMLPALAQQVIAVASDPEVSVTRLSGLVSKDQVLAARVLGLANSAYSAPLQPISTLPEAVVRLGTRAIRNVVVTVCYASRLHDPKIYGPLGPALVDHGIGTAYLARLVAERVHASPDEAFLCGLLHDVGKLVVLKTAHDWRRRTGHEIPAGEITEAIDAHHAELGGLALRQWRLPETLDEPVRFHHRYLHARHYPREAAIAYCANLLSHRYGFGCEADAGGDGDTVFTFLEIEEAWLLDVDARAPGLFEVARQFLS